MSATRSFCRLFLSCCLLIAPMQVAQGQNDPVVVTGDLVIRGNVVIEGDVTINGNLKVNGRIISSDDAGSDNEDAADDIYVRLWKLDQTHSGLSVTLKDASGNWMDPDADLRLDEQGPNTSANSDGATAPMLLVHDESKLVGPTWVTVNQLFDNYNLIEGKPEDQVDAVPVQNAAEDAEVNAFLDAVLATDVLKECLQHINDTDLHGGDDLTSAEFKTMLKNQWFRTYSNHFNGRTVHHASGFEHVFVGEHDGDDIGGHHFWWKFVRDHRAGQAESLGHNYKLRNGPTPPGQNYPWLATFRMLWKPTPGVSLREPEKKGFFVGASPELMLAYGTLSLLHEIQHDGVHPIVTLDGGTFELVVHASTLANGNRGRQVRSAFPILKSLGPAVPLEIIDVDEALAAAEGDNVRVRGVIQAEHNGKFGLRLATSESAAEFLAVKLPSSLRSTFSPNLDPSVQGRVIVVNGRRDRYTRLPGITAVSAIRFE